MTTTMIILGAAALYCLARAVMDFRERRFAWGAAGLLCAILLLLAPVATHAVKVDLPQAGG